jgi:hypothetical protein
VLDLLRYDKINEVLYLVPNNVEFDKVKEEEQINSRSKGEGYSESQEGCNHYTSVNTRRNEDTEKEDENLVSKRGREYLDNP